MNSAARREADVSAATPWISVRSSLPPTRRVCLVRLNAMPLFGQTSGDLGIAMCLQRPGGTRLWCWWSGGRTQDPIDDGAVSHWALIRRPGAAPAPKDGR